MRKILAFTVLLTALAACEKNDTPPDPQQGKGPYDLRIAPVMTKVTQTAFESGDAIGVTVTRPDGPVASNEKMTYDGSVFSGSLQWYSEEEVGATVAAYYPYSATVPTSFTVQADQTGGISSSDFVAGVKEGVFPSAHAITLPFKHKLCLISLTVVSQAGDPVSIALEGARLTAKIGADFTATVDEDAQPGTVVAAKLQDGKYFLVVPPQTVAFTAVATAAGGKTLSKTLKETTLEAGKQYSISLVMKQDELLVVLAAEIDNWEDGGEIVDDNPPAGDELEEHIGEEDAEKYILYHGDKYSVALMKDGKWWMAQNMRYVPAGFTPCDDYNADTKKVGNVTAGVYYPVVVNAGKTAAVFSKEEAVIAAQGYLYQAEVALGLKVGDLTSADAAKALEGTQGICPKGWHVPTLADIAALVGKGVGIPTDDKAPYYDGNNGSIVLLNADGFGMDAFGAVSIQDNTKTEGTVMGWASGYPDKISSGMFCGSTYASVSYNTKDDETSGVKNLQFYGLMPMTNKATEAEYTCNGTKVSYRIAAPLRCVRNE